MTGKLTSTLAIMATLASVGPTMVLAQNTVTLRSQDDAVNLTGELLSFDDNTYVIRTRLGELRISADRVTCDGAGCPRPVEPEIVVAEETFVPGIVTMKSTEGATEITGKLTEFDGETYVLETGFGTLRIAATDATCIGDSCPPDRSLERDVAIAASFDVSNGLVARLVEGFAAHQNGVFSATPLTADQTKLDIVLGGSDETASVTLASSSSTDAVRSLIGGAADLAATTRSVLDAEREALGSAGQPSNETVIALDAIAIAVAPDNPVKVINQSDIARIFAGEITDWAQLGGRPGPINLYVRNSAAGTATVFEELVMEPAGKTVSPVAEILASDADIATAVKFDPQGIGYTSFATLNDARALAVRGSCGIQTPATDFTIKTEEYPLTRRIYMYKPRTRIPQTAAELVDYIKSDDGQSVVNAAGFVGQDVTRVSVNEQGLRFVSALLPQDIDASFAQMQQMMTEFVAADRLSLTFRFEPGSSKLDIRAEQDIERLGEMIRAGQFDGKEIVLAGFTDAQGDGPSNIALSRQRAAQVERAIRTAAGAGNAATIRFETLGFGEMSPLGCNDTENGRRVNRRVEVWTRDALPSRDL